MGPRGRRIWGAAVALGLALAAPEAGARTADFQTWLAGVRHEAMAAGISAATLEAAFDGLQPIPRVIELDRRQPEFTQTFWAYLDKRVTPERVARARRHLDEHRELLDRVRARYGVQPRFLVAFWGLESNFGDFTGGFSVIGALATLAYDGRRGAFFRKQLLDALAIVDQGHITPDSMRGSWAGAMGQVQFIPSTFALYAVDFDGDGRREIWRSLPDIFASAANFLGAIGWRGDETWGREVRLPAGFDWDQAGLDGAKTLAEWQRLGVRRIDGLDLPTAELLGAIVLPGGHKGPAFLVYRNFHAILSWNRSIFYALSVGNLADRIAGRGNLQTRRLNDERPLSRAQVEEMQGLLGRLGLDAGTPDGVVGSMTRAALKAYQKQANLVPDGHATPELLDSLRKTVQDIPSDGGLPTR